MSIADNLAGVRRRIDEACAAADRDPAEVRLLPVSKTKSPAVIREAYDAGVRLFGENKVQEAVAKAEVFADLPDLRWAAIGHLQTNKAKLVAAVAAEFHALDSLRVAEALSRRLRDLDRTLDVFVQVNSSAEESKFGLEPSDVPSFARELERFDALKVRGLMTLAVFSDDSDLVGRCFARMRDLQALLQDTDAHPERWGELSMGMSGDYELAISYGATTVRVGQAIFGDRLNPNDYWPVR
ncbi:MAG: YggS family pyridoxal phosphate-dependent enzyme [Microlunatus sp.]|nr:YggS family pyridoxal phosphate-dependent enzyme [Microlunatus sp.]